MLDNDRTPIDPTLGAPVEGSLLARADALQSAAEAVLTELALPDILAKYGQAHVVGSVALGLMTWRDIDLDVEVVDEIREDEVWDAARHLLNREKVMLVSVADDRCGFTAGRVPSMYVGVRYRSDEDTVWKIDVRFVRSADAIASAHLEDIGTQLTLESRQRILGIKDAVSGRPEYGQTLSGVDVYRAVLSDGAEDLASFDSWLERRGLGGPFGARFDGPGGMARQASWL